MEATNGRKGVNMTNTTNRRLTTKQKVEQFMADNNVDLIVFRCHEYVDLNAWAPPGKVFYATGCHSCVNQHDTAAVAWEAMWEDCQYGIVDCDIEDCEACEEAE